LSKARTRTDGGSCDEEREQAEEGDQFEVVHGLLLHIREFNDLSTWTRACPC
jgi:hypothetical protein